MRANRRKGIARKKSIAKKPVNQMAVSALEEKNNDVICIIGMHRSGTSMVARLLNLCGLDLGPSEQFLPRNEFSPTGYFENEIISYKIDDALLTHFGGSWDNPPQLKEGWEYDPALEQIVHEARSVIKTFSHSLRWGWKDPRTTIVLPFWKSLIPNLRFVICVRSPLEAAKSLARRDRMPIQKGVYLWNQYMRAAIRDTEGCSRIFTFYEDFFENSFAEINRLVGFCRLPKPEDLSSLHKAISSELRHHRSETYELLNEDKLITEYKLFYIGLRALTTDGFVRPTSNRNLENFISENIGKFLKLIEQFHDEKEMAQLQSALIGLESELDTRRVKAESLEVDRDSMRVHVGNLEKIIADKEGQVNNLVDHNTNLEKVIADKEGQIHTLVKDTGNLERIIENKKEQVNQLQATLKAQQQMSEEKEQQVTQLTTEQKRLTHETTQLQATLQSQQQILAEKEQQVTQLTAEQERLSQKTAQLQATVESQQEALEEKEQQVAERDQTIEQMQGTKEALEKEMSRLQHNLETILHSRSWRMTAILRKLYDSQFIFPIWLKYIQQRCVLKLNGFRGQLRGNCEYFTLSLATLEPATIETCHQNSEKAVYWIPLVQIYQEEKPALFAHPPSQVSYRLKIPPRATFQTSVALLSNAWGQNEGGVEFNISISSRDHKRVISRKIWSHPTRYPNHRRWMDLNLSLHRFANQEVNLTLSTSVPPKTSAEFAWSVWGNPTLLSKKNSEHAGTKGKRREFQVGVNLVGFINSEKGLGEAVRSEIRDLEAAGIPYIVNSITDAGSENAEENPTEVSKDNPFDINLIHMNADAIPFFALTRRQYFLDRYNIGYWVWELSTFPEEWYDRFRLFDEIWVPSKFALDAISRVSPLPVIRMPHSINPDPKVSKNWPRARFGLKDDSFVFLFMFDFCSYMERKNPLGLVRAFNEAFSEEDNAVLFIKTSHANHDPESFAILQQACYRDNIMLLDSIVPRDAVNALLSNCDCYVSLHRSEGFGLTMSEAMMLGKPVIATAYSSNTDFMTSNNSFLVKYRLVESDTDHGPYKKGCVWAEPDIEHAAELMRYVYRNRTAAATVAEKGRQAVIDQLHPRVVGDLVKKRLSLLQSKVWSKDAGTNIKAGVSRKIRKSWQRASYKLNDRFFIKAARIRSLVKRFYESCLLLLLHNFGKTEIVNISPVVNSTSDLGAQAVPTEDIMVSVVIPVKNAGEDLQQLLSLIKNQKGFRAIEIIIVDSGSTDRSLKIAEEFEANIIKISPDEFSHSYARNVGAKHASGDVILFTVQDALPTSTVWLHELFWVLKNNDVIAVSCSESPRDDADLFYRAAIWNHFDNFLEVGNQDRILRKPGKKDFWNLKKNAQMSNVACLIYRNIFMKYGLRGNFGEDLDLSIRLVLDGYKIALLSSTKIIHSHNRPPYYYLKRGFVDTLAQYRIFNDYPTPSFKLDRLGQDILFTYELVDAIVCKHLSKVNTPCTVENLLAFVMQKWSDGTQGSSPADICIESNGYLDEEFTFFLENVRTRHRVAGENGFDNKGSHLGEMQGFIKVILKYMDGIYEQIDDKALEDFRASLFKAFALVCGVYLASGFFKNPSMITERFGNINGELGQDV